MRELTHVLFALISCIHLFSSMKFPCVPGCCSLTSPDAEVHAATENAFVTLNPCSISVDDIIVWEHITSPPSQALSLKDSTTFCLLSYTHTHAHTHMHTHICTHTQADCLSVYKCDIHINMHINNSMRLNCMRGLLSSYCEDVNTIRTTSIDMADSINVLKSYKLSVRCNNP